MRAIAQLKVLPEMEVNVNLVMTIEEMRELLRHTQDDQAWPVWQLRESLQKALSKAEKTFVGVHEVSA